MIWVNDIAADNPQAQQAFASLDDVFALEGESITTSSLCSVDKVSFNNEAFYVKRYRRGGEGLAEFVGISKARREWQNLQSFRDWGLPVAELAAYGEESALKVPRRGVVITKEIKQSSDLASLSKDNPEKFQDRSWIAAISRQVADATRVMHQNNFAHNDWKWRNILVVEGEAEPRVYMIDCPSGMTWFGPFFEYRRIKDLACLDKVGHYMLSRSQRLRFYLDYVQRSRLSAQDKKVIRKILAFFKGRD